MFPSESKALFPCTRVSLAVKTILHKCLAVFPFPRVAAVDGGSGTLFLIRSLTDFFRDPLPRTWKQGLVTVFFEKLKSYL